MFNVPKKVNRHVLKAMNVLSGSNNRKRISTAVIINQVKFQMRDLVPVPNVDKAVQKSLKNLSDYGLIKRAGPNRFSIGQIYVPPSVHDPRPNAIERRPFRSAGSRKRSASAVDLNTSRRREQSEDPLSGDEFDQIRKRTHSNNKKFRRSGNGGILPKAQRNYQQYMLTNVCDNCSCAPGYEYDTTFTTEPSDTHLEPVHRLNMGDALTTFEPLRSPHILEIAELRQDSSVLDNIQIGEASKSVTNIEAMQEQNTASIEQVSASPVAEPTNSTDAEDNTSGCSPESSNTET